MSIKQLTKQLIHPIWFIKGIINNKLDYLLSEHRRQCSQIQDSISSLKKQIENIEQNTYQAIEIVKADRDNIPYLRNILRELRKSHEYNKVFQNNNPLISVRIATYNKPKELVDKAIKSVLRQTYQNFEIIVVGDGASQEVEDAVTRVKDKRIHFTNLTNRGRYPDVPYYRWLVAGSPAMNEGVLLAKGEWIAPLDDDDEFTDDHLEKLIELALKTKSELVYGAIQRVNTKTNKKDVIWSDPPQFGNFSFQGAMYLRSLSFFEYDQASWVVREPGDWNLCRRMLESGVRFASTNDIIAKMYYTPIQDRENY